MAEQLERERPVDVAEPRYERDLYGWCLRQAALLREGWLDAIDVENIAEEIGSLGSEQGDKLESAYRILLLHLLKWRHQPARRSRSWLGSITRERSNIARVLRKNPGLKSRRLELFADAYHDARKEAAAETGLPLAAFPEASPFTLEQALDDDFMPEAADGLPAAGERRPS